MIRSKCGSKGLGFVLNMDYANGIPLSSGTGDNKPKDDESSALKVSYRLDFGSEKSARPRG